MIAFYVSGHGYGHATRSAAIISALRDLRPDYSVAVHTAAPRLLFPDGIEYFHASIEPAICESANALDVDITASARTARSFLQAAEELSRREARFLRERGFRLIAADIPFLAGNIARHARLPAIAVGNFTWDWIFEPAGDAELTGSIRKAYGQFTAACRLPLAQPEGWDMFPNVTDVPLVAQGGRGRSRSVIRAELGLTRPTVLIGGRARLAPGVIETIRRESPEFDFLLPHDAPVFSDLVRAADIVVAKIGYSMAAECIAERKRLLFPPRCGFREEEVLRREAPKHIPVMAIPVSEWSSGHWGPHLRALLAAPEPPSTLPLNGAEACARLLVNHLA